MKQKAVQKEPKQAPRKPNLTGIPTQMKLDFEDRSGMSFDDVRVHYHSSEPARLNARAFTDGRDVYLAPREERQLPHELGHVIQRRVRTVLPTRYVGGAPVNDSLALEREADRFAAGRHLPGPAIETPPNGCVQRMSLKREGAAPEEDRHEEDTHEEGTSEEGTSEEGTSEEGTSEEGMQKSVSREAARGGETKSGLWDELVPGLRASEKIAVRKAIKEGEREPFGLEGGDTCTLEDRDFAKKPKDIDDFYESVTPHMKDFFYWINYASYATGDLSSLAATVITNPRYGIHMYWEMIGETDPDKNMKLLSEFLGGVMDRESARKIYVVTDAGARGRWGDKGAVRNNTALYQYPLEEAAKKTSIPRLNADKMLVADLQTAAFRYLESGKLWARLDGLLKAFPESSQFARVTAQSCVEAMRMVSATLEDPSRLEDAKTQGLLQEKLAQISYREKRWFECVRWYLAEQAEQRPDSLLQYHRKLDTAWVNVVDPIGTESTEWPLPLRVLGWATACHDRTRIALQAGMSISEWQKSGRFGIKFPQVEDITKLKEREVERLKFVDGTKLVAISWNRDKRDNLRRAWGLEESGSQGSQEPSYEKALETWLKDKGINIEKAVNRKKIIILWVRKSGERGGAHFENDTSFNRLCAVANQYAEEHTVFLAGDDKDGEADKIVGNCSGEHVYNVTEFWRKGDEKVKTWGGDTRTGQFRLYDYLKRKSNSLLHVGAMSGNLEAMALMGHSVEVHARSPEDSGVSRMQAYDTHDMGLDEKDRLSYRFRYETLSDEVAERYVRMEQLVRGNPEEYDIHHFSGKVEGAVDAYKIFLEMRKTEVPGLPAEIREIDELLEKLEESRKKLSNIFRTRKVELSYILLRGLLKGNRFEDLRQDLDKELPKPFKVEPRKVEPRKEDSLGGPSAIKSGVPYEESAPKNPTDLSGEEKRQAIALNVQDMYFEILSYIYEEMKRSTQEKIEKIKTAARSDEETAASASQSGPKEDKLLEQYVHYILVQAAIAFSKEAGEGPGQT